jgi:DNA-binding HxlR family transcriptional regulator
VEARAPKDLARDGCSVALALGVLGERWTILVLREAFYGVKRFDEMLEAVGCARNLLSARLATLVENGILVRSPYRDEGQRERFEYRLTEKGRELFPVLLALMQWGDRWLVDASTNGPPVEILHRACGARVAVELVCEGGHRHLGPRDTAPRRRRR